LGDTGPYDTSERALADIELFRKDPRKLMLAVVDKQREAKGMDSFAGVYGLIEYNVQERASLDPADAFSEPSADVIRLPCRMC
jgi:hypothetical protein